MDKTEKQTDEIISEEMKELYDKADESKELEEKDDDIDIVEIDYEEDIPEKKEEIIEEKTEEKVEETEEDELIEEEKGSLKKKVLIVLGVLLGILIAVYVGFAIFFHSHFLFNTTVNGKDYSFKSVADVAKDMELQVKEYVLTIEESDGDKEVIDGDDISLKYVQTDELEYLVKGQKHFLWIISLWEESSHETKVTVQFDEAELEDILMNLPCMDSDNQVKSKNARPEFKDTEFVITKEVIGTQIDEDIFFETVKTAITGFNDTLVLSETDCYILPKYVSTSEKVIKACEKMNSYLGAEVTYDMHPHKEVVDASVISQWISVNNKMEVKFSEEKMREYLSEFGKKYDTWKKDREFKAADGDVVTVSGGAYGWLTNEKEEFELLKDDIKNGRKVTREPAYHSFGKAVEHTETDWGDTYAEVDLTDQKMCFIKDGEVVLESPVVTGKPSTGCATPQGVYSLTYKARDAVLRGERDENGEPEYETPVAYWMPFNGGIGFHDATWQSSFGGSRYLTNGSHGCVNMPKDKAAELYELIPDKCPVICHY